MKNKKKFNARKVVDDLQLTEKEALELVRALVGYFDVVEIVLPEFEYVNLPAFVLEGKEARKAFKLSDASNPCLEIHAC